MAFDDLMIDALLQGLFRAELAGVDAGCSMLLAQALLEGVFFLNFWEGSFDMATS